MCYKQNFSLVIVYKSHDSKYFNILLQLSFSVVLNNDLNQIVQKFSEHYHDAWASRKLENGWTYGEQWSDVNKTHPRLKPYNMLSDYERERYKEPVRESLKALLAIGWSVEHAEVDVPSTNRSSMRRSSKSQVRYYLIMYLQNSLSVKERYLQIFKYVRATRQIRLITILIQWT